MESRQAPDPVSPPGPDLSELLTLVGRGDQAAFETVYDRTAGRGVRGCPAGAAGRRAVGGGRPGGAARGVADGGALRPAARLRVGLGDDDRPPPRRGPGALGAGRRGPGGACRVRRAAPASRRGGRGRGVLPGGGTGAPLPGRAERTAAGVDRARVLLRLQLSAGRLEARPRARHGQEPDSRRAAAGCGTAWGWAGEIPALPVPGHAALAVQALAGRPVRARRARRRPNAPGSSGTCAAARPCQSEVRDFAAVAASLGLAAATTPPPSLKGRVLADVGALDAARSDDAAIAAVLSAADALIASAATSAGGTATVVASRQRPVGGVHQRGAARAAAFLGLRAVVHRVRRGAGGRPGVVAGGRDRTGSPCRCSRPGCPATTRSASRSSRPAAPPRRPPRRSWC